MTTFPDEHVYEIEQKIKVSNLNDVINFLENENATFNGTHHVHDIYYDTATRALLRQGRILKLRKKTPIRPFPGDPVLTMSVKCQTEHKEVRDEVEIPVENLSVTERFISLLGFIPIANVTKVRSHYKLREFNILLDGGNLGNYVEIEILSPEPEKSTSAINEFIKTLTFQYEIEPLTYLQLALEHQRKQAKKKG
ncbi:MAG: class IV adenylate cyclase [Candidatus Ranarchaeia archaeon]